MIPSNNASKSAALSSVAVGAGREAGRSAADGVVGGRTLAFEGVPVVGGGEAAGRFGGTGLEFSLGYDALGVGWYAGVVCAAGVVISRRINVFARTSVFYYFTSLKRCV